MVLWQCKRVCTLQRTLPDAPAEPPPAPPRYPAPFPAPSADAFGSEAWLVGLRATVQAAMEQRKRVLVRGHCCGGCRSSAGPCAAGLQLTRVLPCMRLCMARWGEAALHLAPCEPLHAVPTHAAEYWLTRPRYCLASRPAGRLLRPPAGGVRAWGKSGAGGVLGGGRAPRRRGCRRAAPAGGRRRRLGGPAARLAVPA